MTIQTWHPMSGQLRRVGYTPSTDTVSAGSDQTNKTAGQTVTLTATASDGSATWAQVSGPSVTLTPTGALTATFDAPSVTTSSVLVFEATNGTAKDRMSVTVNPSGSGLRFPGDPGIGNILVGANNGSSGGNGYPISWFDSRVWPSEPTRKHTLVREYNNNEFVIPSGLRATLSSWITQGRVPLFSFKNGIWSNAQIASGAADAAIDEQAAWMASLPGPIWMSHFHEPEDNFTTAQAQTDYRAAFKRIITRSKAISGVTSKVAWTTMLMEFSYRGRDWKQWHPNWNGSAWAYDLIDIEGIDLYNPLLGNKITANSRNKTWSQSVDTFLTELEAKGQTRPFCIGEHGLYTSTPTLDDNGVTVSQILSDMASIGAAQQDLVGCAMWDTSNARFDDANDPSQTKLSAWRNMISGHGNVVTI